MTNEELTLQDVAQAAMLRHGGARGRKMGRLAEQAGLTLSYTTFDKILNGTYTSSPSNETLEALVKLSGLSRKKVYEAARRPLPRAPLADRLPEDADSLSREQESAVLGVVRQFASLNRKLARTSGDADGTATKRAGRSPAGSSYSKGFPDWEYTDAFHGVRVSVEVARGKDGPTADVSTVSQVLKEAMESIRGQIQRALQEDYDLAARDTGHESAGERARRLQDEAAERGQ